MFLRLCRGADTKYRAMLLPLLLLAACASATPCPSLHPHLPPACRCATSPEGLAVNCDNVAFPGGFPLLPHRLNIVSFQQRSAGIQFLTGQMFENSDLPLAKLDFSRNSIRRLYSGALAGVETRLRELSLRDNILGDTEEPVFASPELAKLTSLEILDLRDNGIREISPATLAPLAALQILELGGNHLTAVPSAALQGLTGLRVLTLQENSIGPLAAGSFSPVEGVVFLNLSQNQISEVAPGAFANLVLLTTLDLSYNRLEELPHGTLEGLTGLEELDLSSNFLTHIPDQAIKDLQSLRTLVLKDNLIQNLGGIVALGPNLSLRSLDLSRCLLGQLPAGTFRQLSGLRQLRMSVNALRRIGGNDFDGLESLEELHLDDDKILAVPSRALAKVPFLKKLSINYNRIGVVKASSFENVLELRELSLTHNYIREIPVDTFNNLTRLEKLDLYGNLLMTLSPDSLNGVRNTITELNFGWNEFKEIPKFDLPYVSSFIFSKNNISSIMPNTFSMLPDLKYLDLSENVIESLPIDIFYPLSKLNHLDLSKNMLKSLQSGQFNESFLSVINLSGNEIEEVQEKTFQNLLTLNTIDLGHNKIQNIMKDAFHNTPYLHLLRLNNNKLKTFKQDYFTIDRPNGTTEMRILDLGDNEIEMLEGSDFNLLSKMNWMSLAQNKLKKFPTIIVKSLVNLQHLNLKSNEIQQLNDFDLSNAERLREVNLADNMINEVGEKSMQNSTQLQTIDLSYNKIEKLPADLFVGISRLRMDLSNNMLSTFPESIFNKKKISKLQSLNLANNKFNEIPVDALRSQYASLSDLNLSHNNIKNVPHSDVLVNIKGLDLSYNPLTSDDTNVILNEQKMLRYLNLAGTNIKEIPVIKAMFLLQLNISDNNIMKLKEESFRNVTNLRSLDISENRLKNLTSDLASVWPKLPYLRYLDVSGNSFSQVVSGDLSHLPQLRVLRMTNMDEMTMIDSTALGSLSTLEELHLHTLPSVKSVDARRMMETLPGLKTIDIQLTDMEIKDQFHPAFTPRLETLNIRGKSVDRLSGHAFAGINSKILNIGLLDTRISNISSNAFTPVVPMSSRIILNIENSNVKYLNESFLMKSLNDRQTHLTLKGLQSNPLFCNCRARPLHDWLSLLKPDNELYNVSCSAPLALQGRMIRSLTEQELQTCDEDTTTTTTPSPRVPSTKRSDITNNIITIDDMSTAKPETPRAPQQLGILNDMDILIIGIVGGVISVVALIILIACLTKYICDSSKKKKQMLAGGVPCTCIKPPLPTPTWGYPQYPTLPHPASRTSTLKVGRNHPASPMNHPQYGTLGGRSTNSYRPTSTTPYYLQNCPPDYDQD